MKPEKLDLLSEAALHGDVKSIKNLLPRLSLAKDRKTLELALGHAVNGGHFKAVELLLNAGANPDSKAVSNSLLMEAAENGDLKVVKLLVEAGADIHRKIAGTDAFAAALEMDQVKVAEFLKSRGADWATATLRHACENGNLKRARQALDAGADVESKSLIACDRPLTTAAGNGHAPLVRLLLQRGANPNARVEGKTALFDAARHGGNLEVVEALINGGANLHADWDGETVLMAAAASGHLPIVKRLIELGADVQARDKNLGNSVMDHARKSKNKELVAYLKGLGVAADRDAPRALAHTLAREYGGKVVEHSAGFLLNGKINGMKGQFNIGADGFSLFLHGLNFGEKELKGSKDAQIIFSETKPDFQRQRIERVKEACLGSRVLVFRTKGLSILPEPFVISFSEKCRSLLEQMEISGKETIRLGSNFATFFCPHLEIHQVRERLNGFVRLIQKISHAPKPERHLFKSEWLLKPAAKSAATAHSFGGRLEQAVACSQCGCATNLMAQLDLSDPALPKTALGRSKLPVFWCLGCLEWDAPFFALSESVPKPLAANGKKVKPKKIETGEEDLPARRMKLVPVAAGKKAGRKSKLGGTPTWLQSDQTPDCPKCKTTMPFILQLASDSRISYGDMGMLYAFACPTCKTTASLVQSH